jgi:peptidoglycan/LPS O-acetylase OafA/YrhL
MLRPRSMSARFLFSLRDANDRFVTRVVSHRSRRLSPLDVASRLSSQFWLVVRHDLGCYVFGDTWRKYAYHAYSKPYTRVPAHLVGMAFGFLNERWISDAATRPSVSAPALRSTLVAAAAALLACVFAPLSDYRDAESWPPWANGLFITFSRPLWAAALGVVATACAAGRLPRVDAFLAHPAWTPLARLTFGAYLMHPVVIKWFAGTATAPYHFSPHYMVSCAMLNAACAFALAAALWLAVEKPGMRLAAAVAGGGNAARRGESGRGGGGVGAGREVSM